ncbi:helix-turn-helix domain-containing protein [Rufibacter glacialis]|uniref:Helix-turn-helix domain-containing protein n=1 Tax=Rufibacter glacialis TaxID=1259555 RepID=A0A5M8QIC1_9BACT|nr:MULTISPECIES: helix-turn-helix domain-containing protein [Rufibacter]KAA6434700.1 helix-turn-helix domain-containing protein [Rufibacter glacialis]GGK71701.1 hypothetical protein GCM10011405_19910 [Rufibacter glacialis]
MNIIVTTETHLRELITQAISTELRLALDSSRQKQTATDSLSEILNVQQAAKLLNLASSTIYGLVNKSKLPHYKKGGKLRFKRSQLLEWIDSGEKKTQSQIEKEVRIHTRRPSKF